MATNLEKPVTRRVPEITNDEGRALEASLTPDNGGSVALRWVGLRVKIADDVNGGRKLVEL